MGKSKNPDYPDAHPTAPGGMSKKALRAELVSKHNYLDAEVGDDMMTWPELIEAVVAGRLEREAEARELVENPPLLIKSPDTLDYTFAGHAGAGPSGAERWMNCTKSLGLSRKFLETLTPAQAETFAHANPAARQGTTAHKAGEVELAVRLGQISPEERDATLLELAIMPDDGEEYTDDMGEAVSVYVDLIQQFIEERGSDHVLIENRLEAAVWLTGDHEDDYHVISGSGDTVVLPTKSERSIVVVDYKHGEGHDVTVENNPQVRIYGLGALTLLTDDDGNLITDVDEVVYYIVQPRTAGEGHTGIKEWRESLDDLLTWRDDVLAPALTAALYDDASAPAEFKPTPLKMVDGDADTCQWCPAKGTCPALTMQRMNAADDLFDVIVEAEYEDGPGAFPETDTLDSATLGKLLTQIDGLVKIREDMRAEAQRRLHRGEQVPGYKMVGYTPPRKWTSDAAEELHDTHPAFFKEKMVTPKQALTLLKTEGVDDSALGDFIETFDPVPVIAPEGDRRKTWTSKPPESMFDALDEED